MSQLDIILLGHPRILRNGHPVIDSAQSRVLALLAYLAMEADKPAPRGTLAGMLWPDQPEDRARHNLRQALSTLRRSLESPDSVPVLEIQRETVAFHPDARSRVDAQDILDLLAQSANHDHRDPETCLSCLDRLDRVAALYTGPFLNGFSMPDSDLYDDWSHAWRQRLHGQVVDALDGLISGHIQQDNANQALHIAQRLLELDPYREIAHRGIMQLQARDGKRPAALRQFNTLRRLLEDDLGVDPEPETIALRNAIRDGASLPRIARAPANRHVQPATIPAPPTRLVGRERELAEIADLLNHRDCRLLTIHGPGGSGKTRLAIELATTQAATHQVTAFVQLAGESDAEGVVAAISDALGLANQGAAPAEAQLHAWLREHTTFLVLDNAEHVVEELGIVETMLATAPNLTILITSRERLGHASEWIYALDGLTYPRATVEDSPEGYGAIGLLVERMRQVRGGSIPREEYPELTQICQLVEGMPLALEMAASWATTLPADQIANGIRDSLDFLAASSRPTTNVRHRSMRAVVQSSWDRLDPDSQAVFRRISVFEDGFTLEAATHITGASAASLATLINASLLSRSTSGRLHLHGVLAQFAHDQLRNHPAEHDEMHERHARYFLALIAGEARELNGLDQLAALQTIGDDLANIMAGWEWAIKRGNVTSLLDAAPVLWLYFVLLGRMHAGDAAFGRLLDTVRHRALPDVAGHDMLAAMAYCHAGGFRSGLGHYDEAISLLEEALRQLGRLVSGRSIGLAHNMLAAALVLKGDHDTARMHLEEGLAESGRVRDIWSMAFALNDLGMLLHLHFGEPDAASYCERGRQLFRQSGDVRGEALAAHNLGVIATSHGTGRRALALHREALALREAIGDLWGMAMSLVQLGMVSSMVGERDAARSHLRRALRLAWDNSILPLVLEALVELATLDPDTGQSRTALAAIARHPSVQEPVRARCEELLASNDEELDPIPFANADDLWAIRTVDQLARDGASA